MNTIKPVALVTGASSGIGAAFARRLSALGYRCILVARRRDKLEQLAGALGDAEVLAADLAVDAELLRVEERIKSEPALEFLVNNAGFGTMQTFLDSELAAQDRMHRVHVMATMRLTHAALKGMVERRQGNIINVSSVAAFFQNPKSVSYCSTKAWINSFTESLFVELKGMRSPVRVQALCPGFTRTEFHEVLGLDTSPIPKSLWATGDQIVEESLRGLRANRVIVIPGWRYRLLIRLNQCLPRPVAHFMALAYGGRNRNPAHN
jgi:short-subunit dehydrogenase